MYLKLMITVSGDEGKVSTSVQEFIASSVVIGRSESDLNISHSSCSKRHAILTQDAEGEIWLTDLGSKNGIFIEGQKIKEAKIRRGQKIQLGKAILEVISTTRVASETILETKEEERDEGDEENSIIVFL